MLVRILRRLKEGVLVRVGQLSYSWSRREFTADPRRKRDKAHQRGSPGAGYAMLAAGEFVGA